MHARSVLDLGAANWEPNRLHGVLAPGWTALTLDYGDKQSPYERARVPKMLSQKVHRGAFPDGWLLSGQISRDMSVMKKKS
ncbi:hypothetical protein EIP91_003022 [Steccherinum ochraceum]|uniref:Uncharacterized protein n=1 Tax=Steccherinum ochraceum TaxID=92696 RepID=A0A4R0RDL8_9APHY|nr:hypothetical protein EIP91_003022 [Steccherinum ochraceum]